MRSSVRFLIIAAALAVAGCGGGSTTTTTTALSKQEYATKLGQYMTPLVVSSLHLGVSFKQLYPRGGGAPTTRQQLTSAMASFDGTLQQAGKQLAALDPPSDAARSNADLVTALNTFAKSGARAEQALRSGTKQEVHARVGAFLSVQQTFNSTFEQIRNQLKSEGIPLPGR